MFLLFGIRPILRTIARGTFHCPREGVDCAYRRCSVRTWFTLFFVPLIPLKKHGELVQCESCRTRFDVAVLELPTSGELADQLVGATRHAVAALLRRLTPLTTAQRPAALGVLRRRQADADESWIDHDLAALDDASLAPYLPGLATSLTTMGKESFVADLAWIAAADGPVGSAAQDLLESIGGQLGMTPAHVRGVTATAADQPR